MTPLRFAGISSTLALLATPLAHAAALPGAELGLIWAAPFLGLLLSIALFPLVAPAFWHHHFGKISALWAAAFLLPAASVYSVGTAVGVVLHALVDEYIPFIVLLFALYTVSGGVFIAGNLHGSPKLNTTLLAIGTVCASIMGTTGAAMLLIRPLLRANDNRKHNVHVVVFFIFLVANIGGGLTPIGDPPLFLGFLKGVDFMWTVKFMAAPVAFAAACVLLLFFLVDSYLYRKEGTQPADPTPDQSIRLEGAWNFVLVAIIVGAVLLSGLWKPNVAFAVGGVELQLQNLVRDVILLLAAGVSLALTPKAIRVANDFNWFPMLEVGKLFAGIFIAMAPAIAMLRAGTQGAFAPLVGWVTSPQGQPVDGMYFWMTGVLSSFLDNAPTYLVFFNLAHGDAAYMMANMASTLLAISAGAVFMGANTYIGNAPNFMVKAIAESQGVKMPSFFAYMLWSTVCLMPIFAVLSVLFF